MGGAAPADPGDESNADEPPLPTFSEEEIHVGEKYSYHDTLSSLIGLGSYGVVFKGNDHGNNMPVAVKRLAKMNIKDQELSVIKSLKSKYLVGVLDICDIDPVTSCVIMELLDTDLDNHLRKRAPNGRLTPKNLKLIIDNLARGYKALNELRIVHRDIKPQNILVSYQIKGSREFSGAKITDFGIARTLGEASLCNVAGTFYYMAPEVGANLLKICEYNSKVDIWSIGCLIYQCLTGDIPFDECSLCRLFLYMAGGNYEAYDYPELPEGTSPLSSISFIAFSTSIQRNEPLHKNSTRSPPLSRN
ncbi:unnamed protein product, partial [Mesorhabditis belari]|uniref:Protein kinase domain-containing protein n=1 Tax=Mesorhabditis belari TaxID=2138241 RepID=A0AAF3EM06_9BILA